MFFICLICLIALASSCNYVGIYPCETCQSMGDYSYEYRCSDDNTEYYTWTYSSTDCSGEVIETTSPCTSEFGCVCNNDGIVCNTMNSMIYNVSVGDGCDNEYADVINNNAYDIMYEEVVVMDQCCGWTSAAFNFSALMTCNEEGDRDSYTTTFYFGSATCEGTTMTPTTRSPLYDESTDECQWVSCDGYPEPTTEEPTTEEPETTEMTDYEPTIEDSSANAFFNAKLAAIMMILWAVWI